MDDIQPYRLMEGQSLDEGFILVQLQLGLPLKEVITMRNKKKDISLGVEFWVNWWYEIEQVFEDEGIYINGWSLDMIKEFIRTKI